MDIQSMLLTALLSFVVMVLTLLLDRMLNYIIWQPLRIDYKMKCLEKAMKDLQARYNDVQIQVCIAELALMTCTGELKRWLQKVESIKQEVIDIEVEISNWRSDHGGFPGFLKFWKRYSIGHKVVHKLKEVTKLLEQRDFKDVATKLPSTSKVRSMNYNRDQILEYLKEDEVRCIGIWGMGGVGKTTLLKVIYNYLACNQHVLFDYVIFVVASRNVIHEEFQKKILKIVGLPSQEDDDLSIRATRLLNFVKKNKVLLLLDDLREYVNLVDLGFSLKQGKCKVVFTTRYKEVCSSMNADRQLKVRVLDSKDAWSLFEENVGKNIIEANPNIRSRAEKVVKECYGLPLALITIGKVMSGKKTWRQWQDALNLLSCLRSVLDEVFRTLEFSYENLPDDMTRACFLSCSMWPEDFAIERDDLVMCWMGLGLLNDYSEINTVFDKGHSIIESLIDACLLEHVGMSQTNIVKMHNVLRNMALWIALDHGMSENKWIVKAGLGLTDCQVQDWVGPERISLMHNRINSFLGQPPVGSKLSVLLLNKNDYLRSIPQGIFDCLGSLTYLDLSCSSIENLPKDISKLVNLEFLNISCTQIRYLPDGFNNLVKLKYLLLKETEVRSISWKLISSLPNLKMLDLYHCPAVEVMESQGGIEALDRRQIALGIDVFTALALNHIFNLSTICILKLRIQELEDMESLELFSAGLSGSKPTTNGLQLLEISGCRNLKKLVAGGSRFGTLQILKTLQIRFCRLLERIVWRGVTPREFLPSLRSLWICGCHMLKNISWVSQLPNLVLLNVQFCDGLEMVTGDAEGICPFSRLKELYLYELPNLGSICSSTIPFPSLECLTMIFCPECKKLPFKKSNIPNKLRQIVCETGRWHSLEWEDDDTKPLLERYLRK